MKVSEDEALFASYFWWRKFYRARPCSEQHEMGVACHRETFTTAYCQLCARLHHQPLMSRPAGLRLSVTRYDKDWQIENLHGRFAKTPIRQHCTGFTYSRR